MSLVSSARTLTALVLCSCLGTRPASAQTPDAEALPSIGPYLAGGLSFVALEEGSIGQYLYLSSHPGGKTTAVNIASGFQGVRLGIGAELVWTSEMSARQQSRDGARTTHHRDLLLSGVVRGVIDQTARFSLEAVSGVTFGFGRERYTDRIDGPGQPLPDYSSGQHYFGMTGGAELFARASRRVQVGGSIRATLVERVHNIMSAKTSGLSAGALVRIHSPH